MSIAEIKGKVIKGKQFGTRVGYPTANLDTKDHGLIKTGVYCGYVTVQEKEYAAVLCVNWSDTVEVHILGLCRDIYGADIDLRVTDFIRFMDVEYDLKVKEDIEKLKKTIENDIVVACKKLIKN